MKVLIFLLLSALFLMAFHPFDLGQHMGQSTGGAGGSFPPSSGDSVLWDSSNDVVLWDASGDKVIWD